MALSLLMRDGAVQVTFHPRLTPDQYAELTEIVSRAHTRAELRRGLEQAAEKWEVEAVIDG